MKKFFKALALVLALTLVIGTIPVSAAEYEFSLEKEKKIIYLGGASGEKEVDGATVKCGTKSRYKISKLVKGFDPATMDIQLESSDPSIVKTSNAKDKVYAKAIGTADVTIYVIDKETGKQLKDLTVKVQVKKNATAPLIPIIMDADGKIVDLTATKVGVNVPYIVTLPRKDADGNFVDTDYRSLTCDDASVSIEATNKYSTQYKVTFTKSGTFAITVASYQSKIWNKLQNVVTVPVTAGYDVEGVEQSALDTVKVTFKQNVAGLKKENFSAYYKINDVVIPYSDVAEITPDANDKNVVYVKFLSDFIANTEFTVKYDGNDVGTFTAVDGNKADAVKTVLIPTQRIVAGAEAAIDYKLLDENDIDITKGVLAITGSYITFEIASDDFNNYVVGDKIFIKNADTSVTVKATYHYLDKDNNDKTVPGEGQIVAYAAPNWEISAATGVITLATADGIISDSGKKLDTSKALTVWSMDDAETAALQIYVPYKKGNDTVYEGIYETSAEPAMYNSYWVKVADDSVILLGAVDGQKQKLIANKPGSTTILIYGHIDDGNKDVVIGAVPVTVKEGRKIGSWTITASKTNLNLTYLEDAVSFEILIKDQDGQTYTKAASVTVEETATGMKLNNTFVVKNDDANGKITVTIKSSDLEGEGTHNLKFTVKDGGDAKTVRLAAAKDGDAQRYLLKLDGTTALSTNFAPDTKNAGFNIKLEGVSSKGTAAAVASGVSLKLVYEQPKAISKSDKSYDAAIVGTFVYTISKDGKILDKDGVAKALTTMDGSKISAFKDVAASGAAVKLADGSYVVKAYKILDNATSAYPDPVGTAQTFTVTNDQATVAVAKNANAEKLDVITEDQIIKAFDITLGGKNINDIAGVTAKVDIVNDVNIGDGGKTAYVKKITVVIANNNGLGVFEIPTEVGAVVRTK